MTKPKFNPALPYTFEDTEEGYAELLEVLKKYCQISENDQFAFKGMGRIINGYQMTHLVRWNTTLNCYQYVDNKNQRWVDSIDLPMPVVYDPSSYLEGLKKLTNPVQPNYKPEDFRPSIIFTNTFAAGDGLYKVTVEKVS